MALRFGEIRQPEGILGTVDPSGYILACEQLPDPDTVALETCRFLLKYQEINGDSYSPGIIYIVREIDGTKTWIDVSITERGVLDPPTSFWKRLTPDAIVLHWISPEDKVDDNDPFESATWDHDVIVRKLGEDPMSPDDGEIVGYSSVRSGRKLVNGVWELDPNVQYGEETAGFVHPIDPEYDKEYRYRIFSVTKSGRYTGTTRVVDNEEVPFSIRAAWTWKEIKDEIGKTDDSGQSVSLYQKMFRIGDTLPLPYHEKYGQLYAQIVDFHYAHVGVWNETTYQYNDSWAHGLTFMITNVLGADANGCGGLTFDNRELKYAASADATFKDNKTYYVRNNTDAADALTPDDLYRELDLRELFPTSTSPKPGIGEPIQPQRNQGDIYYKFTISELNPSIRYFARNRTVILSGLDVSDQTFDKTGNGAWFYSNIRTWLNTYKDTEANSNFAYHKYASNDVDAEYKWKIVDQDEQWRRMSVVSHENVAYWREGHRNGWFESNQTQFHDVAPDDTDSVHYVEVPLFINGFTSEDGKEFVNCVALTVTNTMTDQYIYRYNKSQTNDAVNASSEPKPIRTTRDRFWIPSFMEIFGNNPRDGLNGSINYTDLNSYGAGLREGWRTSPTLKPFALFDPNYTYNANDERFSMKRSVPYSRDLRIKTDIRGVPTRWYTRTVDQTSPGRVFYIDKQLPDDVRDPASVTNLTCTAHRPATDDPIGAVVCFTIA